MTIRVISGSAKGRRLKLVPGNTTRPIMDKVKESLFNIIGRNVVGSIFLDLFAGTGSVGIEALSRGARKAIFIDIEHRAIKTIEENLSITQLKDFATVQRVDALSYLKGIPVASLDFIYIAPPQYRGMWLQVLQVLESNPQWISPKTTLIIQIDPTEEKSINLSQLEVFDKRRYGNTLLLFLKQYSAHN